MFAVHSDGNQSKMETLTKRYHFEILGRPRGETYRALIRELAALCPFGMLNHVNAVTNTQIAVLDLLRPDIVTRMTKIALPGLGISPLFFEFAQRLNNPAHVYVFRVTEHSLSVLLRATNRLYGWRWPQLPEDLCLLREDWSPCLLTVVRDDIAYLYMTPAELFPLLERVRGLRVSVGPLEDEWDEEEWWRDDEELAQIYAQKYGVR